MVRGAPGRADALRSARAGRRSARASHALIAAPTGSGKTLAAFLAGLDALVNRRQRRFPTERRLLYVSPLRALSNDVQKNLEGPLAEIRAARPLASRAARPRAHGRHAGRRTRGDGPPAAARPGDDAGVAVHPSQQRAAAARMLRTVRTVIVDEIHALVGTSAAATWRSRSSGSRPSPASRSAHRPLGDAEAARGCRPLSRRAPAESAPSWMPGRSGNSTSA